MKPFARYPPPPRRIWWLIGVFLVVLVANLAHQTGVG